MRRWSTSFVGRLFVLAMSASTFAGGCIAQDIHILLRPKNGKTSFHMGEPIALEAACMAVASQQYLSPCVVVLRAEPLSPLARLSADRISQMTWLDAQSGGLPPEPRGECGNIENSFPSQRSQKPDWRTVTLGEPFPVHPGEYKLKAALAFDLEMSDRFGEPQTHSSTDEVQIGLDDNLGWKNHLLSFRRCDYDVRLSLVPDSDAVAALRKHLGECALDSDESLALVLHEIVWLKMQVEEPDLYARMLDLEHTGLPFRREEEAELQKVELEQARVSTKADVQRIRQWFRNEYRSLLAESGRSLVAIYRSSPELRNQGFQEDEENDFDSWYDVAASLPEGADAYVSRREVADFLRRAGASQQYVSAFLKNHKSSLPLQLPEYHQ